MPTTRLLLYLLWFFPLTLIGCGGGGEGSGSATAQSSVAGINVSPSSTITSAESGLGLAPAIISVSLSKKPTADVTIPVNSSNTNEGKVSIDSLVFTSENWSTIQTISVTGVDDTLNDGDQNYTIHLGPAKSTDSSYNSLEKTLSAINLDERKATFVVSAISGNTDENGTTAFFNVHLGYAPSANVTIPVRSSNTQEGTVDKDLLTFTTSNWEIDQKVTVTGVDDSLPGNQPYTVILDPAQSNDTIYANRDPNDVDVVNLNVSGTVDITNISSDHTDEAGGTVTFQVQLHSRPHADVYIPLESSNPNEGIINQSSLTFTPNDWNQPQTITVTGVEDPISNDNPTYSIMLGTTSSADADYSSLDPADVSLTNLDVKTGKVKVTPTALTTYESGSNNTATFDVQLATRPFADVTIPITSKNTGEGTVDKNQLTFNSLNWDQPQTVTVTGVSDNLADGDVTYNIELGPTSAPGDDNYDGIIPESVAVTNRDVRVASFVVSSISGNTTEAGGKASFTVKLESQPTQDVSIDVQSDNTGEGTVSTNQLLFTNTNWNTDQTIVVTGVSDTIYDPAHAYNIILAAAVSTDPIYNGANPPDVPVINDDVKNGIVSTSKISGNTDESGNTAFFQVSLNSQPAADVTMTVSSSNLAEGTVSPATLTFTSTDWAPKTVTVIGVADSIADGNQSFFINISKTSSPAPGGDNNFDGLDVAPVSVTNVDLVDPYGVTPAISAGAIHSLVLANDGTVWGWGQCSGGQIDATPTSCPGSAFILPQRLNITKGAAISAGDSFSVVVRADGSVWTSGANDLGQLGHAGGSSLAPVEGLTDPIKAVAAGGSHVLAQTTTDDLWAWGYGRAGQLGNGLFPDSSPPVKVTFPTTNNVKAIAAGTLHSLALDKSGNVFSWGSDGYEQLGLGAGDQQTATPTAINLLTNVTAIGAGQEFSFAVGKYNSSAIDTFGWGNNSDSQLGTGAASATPKSVPTALNTFSSAVVPTRLDGGYQHSIALVGSSVYAWGDNDNSDGTESWNNSGALGRRSATLIDSDSPVQTFTASGTVIDINAGRNFSLALISDGRIQTSGMNDAGQLGTNEFNTLPPNNFTNYPYDVEDPGDRGALITTYSFYAYRPILSGQPATTTTITSATIAVCWNTATNSALPNCGPITQYEYSLDGSSWSGPFPISTPITLSDRYLIPGTTVTLSVIGINASNKELQTPTSAATASWFIEPTIP